MNDTEMKIFKKVYVKMAKLPKYSHLKLPCKI